MLKTRLSILPSLILLCLYSTSPVFAANDWSKPCFSGSCSYDIPDTSSGPSGTLKIWGSDTSIADVTPAGGWEIIGCDPNKVEQDIRIVCRGIDVDGDGDNDGCWHLFAGPSGISSSSGNGNATSVSSLPVPTGTVVELGSNSTTTGDDEDQKANGKIVRLPQQCGKQAFGRIAKAWTHEDQTVPSHISKRLLLPLHRRSKHIHKVKGITIDARFQETDGGKHGEVKFSIVGANVPGAKASEDWDGSSSSSLAKRLMPVEFLEKERNGVQSRVVRQRRGIIGDVGDAIGDGAGAVAGGIKKGAGKVGDAAGAVKGAVTGEKHFDKSVSAPLDISKTFNIFEKSIKCSSGKGNGSFLDPKIAVSGKLGVDVEAGVHGNVKIAISASGSLTHLRVDSFEVSTTLNADLEGAIIMSAGVGGSIDSGKKRLIEVGLPGLDFPGIFSVGPTFQINARAKVSLDIDTDMRIGVAYSIDDLQFDFPHGGKKSGKFGAGDTPIRLSAQPSASATGKVEAHLIPSLNLGISAFEGVAQAEVFVNLDASAAMTLTVDATLPSAEVNITHREAPTVEIVRRTVRGTGPIGGYYFDKRSPVPEPFGFGDLVDGIKDGAKKAAGAVKSGAKKAAGTVESGAKKTAGAVSSGAKKAAGAVKSGAKKAGAAVSSGAKKVVDGAKKAVGSGEKKVAGAVKEGAKKVESGAKKVGGAVKDGAKKVETGAKKVVKEGAKKVESGAKKVEGAVEDGAKKAGKAIKAGAKKVGGAIADGAKDVKDALDHSPKSTSTASKAKSSASSTSAAPKATDEKKVTAVVNGDVKFGGCLEMDAGFSVNAGADASFFGLFDPSKTVTLFEKQFSLFKKCFGDGKKRRGLPDLGSRHHMLVDRGLKCNGGNVSGVAELANQVVSPQ